MKLFQKKSAPRPVPELVSAQRSGGCGFSLPAAVHPCEKELYDRLRYAVPIIDAAIMKIIRLTGGFRVKCSDESCQQELDSFLENVPVGLTGRSVGCFADNFLDSLITYGSAVGEIVTDNACQRIAGLWNGDISRIRIASGADPFSRSYSIKAPDGSFRKVAHPERIVYSSLTGGHSVLRGLPSLSGILMRIYECIGQNYDRAGNVRYAVTYKPQGEAGDMLNTRERAQQIAREWADGMNSAKYGQVKDFVAVGDVDIKVIGADNKLFDTNVPVRQILEQLIAKLSIPPFLLGLSWSSTERMSSQQADILTSELEYYRRLLTPVICDVGNAFLASTGSEATCSVEWENINLQDETALAEARLKNAQAREIEMRLEKNV
ncbi:MAG: serine/threonine protein phosphatase [Ruminococcus sp.]|uniref:serine/threonine protein phosphatase n=1 Tax=Ruminococcus sp. TaxID=41978 RepID=UPI0025CE8A99|nr:serine/threonine protein phosphatase [Ruminococcus sp.]MBR5683970.1 serine/threonine protein phosphatase [Ruminococcus sp.]